MHNTDNNLRDILEGNKKHQFGAARSQKDRPI